VKDSPESELASLAGRIQLVFIHFGGSESLVGIFRKLMEIQYRPMHGMRILQGAVIKQCRLSSANPAI